MKAREKLLISISLLACAVAIGVFALVSLGHFIYSPNRPTLPVVGKMYESTVQQIALLEPVPVPQPTPPTKNTPAPPPAISEILPNNQTNHTGKSLDSLAKNRKSDKNDRDYDELKKALATLFGLL